MSENTVNKRVDYRKVYQEMKKHRRLYLIVLPITLVLSAIYIYSIPRIYGTQAKVAPETENPNSNTRLWASRGMPMPVFRTVTRPPSGVSDTVTVTLPPARL